MLGIEDGWVAAAYLLCIGSSVLCVAYSAMNWNRGDDSVKPEDVAWQKEETKVGEELDT
jgi:hypothetical protein